MGRRTLVVGDGSIGLSFRSVSGDLRIHGAARDVGPVPIAPIAPMAPVAPIAQIAPVAPIAPLAAATADFGRVFEDLERLEVELRDLGLPDLDLHLGGTPSTATEEPPTSGTDDPAEASRMAILRALEAGELDVASAMDRLAALDATADERPTDV